MARLVFPDEGSRLAYRISTSTAGMLSAAGTVAVLYSDAAATTLADVRAHDGTTTPGAVLPGSTVTVDAYSRLPLFWGPDDGTDVLYAVVSGGPATPVYARTDDRVDATTAAITAEATARAAGDAASQPLDSDLSAIAALSTSAYGRSLLALADAAAGRVTFGAPSQVTTYLSGSGNYTIPTGAKILEIDALAGGAGGGSGRQGAASTVRCGGGVGANGAFVQIRISVVEILAVFPSGVLPYNVGSGTAGGAAATTPDTNGNPGGSVGPVNYTWVGSADGPTSIGVARLSTGASGGTAFSGASSSFIYTGTVPNYVPNSASTTGGATVQNAQGCGGQGGGITVGNVPSAGAGGNGAGFGSGFSGTGGVVDGAAPTSGTIGVLVGPGDPPGGGAASITGPAQAGANGLPNSGAGGAGGGASLNGFASGAGGDGGSGFLRITASF